MKRYKYLEISQNALDKMVTEEMTKGPNGSQTLTQLALNVMGDAGWKLVTIRGKALHECVYYFMKRVKD